MSKPFVQIRWYDAEDYKEANWSTEEDLKKFSSEPCEAVSYGYVVKKNRGYITIAADYIAPDTFGRIMKIPRKMVVSIEPVTLPEPPAPAEPSEPQTDTPTH